MRTLKRIALLMGLGMAVAGAPAYGGTHEHHHHAQTPAKLSLDNGKKWATDDALREGMKATRDLLAGSLDPIHHGKMSRAGYEELAGKIDERIAAVVANCKLDAKADAQLHIVIAEIAAGVDAMRGKGRKPNRMGGAVKVLQALESYDRYFDHPGWQPIKH